jgi:hypothetical protein
LITAKKGIKIMEKYEINRRYQFDGDTSPADGEAMITVWFESGNAASSTAKQVCWFCGTITHFMVLEYPPEKHVRWMNVYDNVNESGYGDFFKTREQADGCAVVGRTACVKVEYMDGEGI